MSRTPEQMQDWKDQWASEIIKAVAMCPGLKEDDIAFALRTSRSTARRLLEYVYQRTGCRDIPRLHERCQTNDIFKKRNMLDGVYITLPTNWQMVVNRRNDLDRIQAEIAAQHRIVRRSVTKMRVPLR